MVTPDPTDPQPIVRQTFDTARLVATHPPRFTHSHKRLVYALAHPPHEPVQGTIVYSRWHPSPLPERVPAKMPEHTMHEDVFGYEPAPEGAVEWYLNFADPHLFVAYAGSLLAQDELQVLEHPALGALCEALRASDDPRLRPITVDDGIDTPVLVRGVERRCSVATDPDPTEGRPLGLYGNRFARAKEDAVRRAVTVLSPPRATNILAMSAPPGGYGRYRREELVRILTTASAGFRAARLEAAEVSASAFTVVHTGHWGTGAFGGNKVVMTLLQSLAARVAGIDRLVYHTFDELGTEAWEEARRVEEGLFASSSAPSVTEVVDAIHARGFVWGVSDGN
jgi:hypothetical protein